MLLLFCSMQMQLGMYLHVFMAQNCRHSSGKLTQHECKFRAASLLPFQGPLHFPVHFFPFAFLYRFLPCTFGRTFRVIRLHAR